MSTVYLPTALLPLFPNAPRRLELEASNVLHAIDSLNARYPGMRDRLVTAGPSLREHLNVFVDGNRARLDTPLRPGATVYIMTAMSGG